MKNTYLLSFILFITVIGFSGNAHAQKSIGGGLGYGTQISSPSIHVDGQYFLSEQLAISPSFVYYFPKSEFDGWNFKWFEFNANVNYYFDAGGSVKPYGLGGLNFSFISYPFFDFANIFSGSGEITSKTNMRVGLNLGIGADFDIGSNVVPFGQLRYNLATFDQLAIEGGIRILLN